MFVLNLILYNVVFIILLIIVLYKTTMVIKKQKVCYVFYDGWVKSVTLFRISFLFIAGGERYIPTHLHLCKQAMTEENLECHLFL